MVARSWYYCYQPAPQTHLQYKLTWLVLRKVRIPLRVFYEGAVLFWEPKREFPKVRGTLFWGPYNKDPTIWGAVVGSPIFGNSQIGTLI